MHRPENLRAALLWLLRTSTLVIAGIAWLGLVVVALGMEWVGQRNIATAFCMFLPRWIWAFPLAMTAPVLLLVNWKAGLGALVTVLLYWGPWSGYEWLGTKEDLSAAADVRLLTWNRGQSNGESLQPFKKRVRPDVIVLQDSARRLPGYENSPDYADLPHLAQMGEFLVLSRFPVRTSIPLAFATQPEVQGARQTIIGARFEIESPSGPFALYTVHFPTPRDTLSFYRRGVPVYGLIGIPGTGWGAKRATYQAYWDGQANLHRQLAERLRTETLPKLLAGDFNTPAFGPWHRMYTRLLSDSHSAGGAGFGYTFPGKTSNPLALFRGWLRLDRILADEAWELTCQETEINRGSQHLAVFAGYRFVKKP